MRLPISLKVGLFSVAIMGGYTYFANSIPQIESKPPQELSLEGGNVTPAQLIKAGDEIYKTKGTCEICHRIGQKGTRAPDLGGVGARAAKAKPGMTAKAYLIESLGGNVDVTLNDIPATVGAGGAGGTAAAAEVKMPGDPKLGKAVYMGKGTCLACHKAGDIPGTPVGPDLSQIAKIQTPDYIMRKILDPKGMGTVANYPAGVMPQDFGTRLTSKEYVDLMAFLLTLK